MEGVRTIEKLNSLEEKYKNLIETNPSLNRKLISFQANKKIPVYNWFQYKEGFSYEMVKMFLKDYGKIGSVLDPFSGLGTTLFVSQEMGFNSFGIELLPIGKFIMESRYSANKIDFEKLSKIIKEIKITNFARMPIDENKKFKHIKITESAFPKETENKINSFLTFISKLQDKNIEQILKFACFSTLEKISYTRKDGQYLRWDYRSQKARSNFNKGKIYSFEEALYEKLDQILQDIKSIERTDEKIEFKTGSCLEILPTLKEKTFDLIISSPPYCNRYDYTRTYALELVFLGVDENEIRNLRQNMLSCTVENKDKIEYLREIYTKNKQLDLFENAEETFNSIPIIKDILDVLDYYRKNKKLNNPGIYRMVKNYFYEHSFIIFEFYRLLKPGGRVYYVNDNVRYVGITIPIDIILSEIAKKTGFDVKKIFVLQRGKGNSSQQMARHGRSEVRKCVYIWEKTNE